MEKHTMISSTELLCLVLGSALMLPYSFLPLLTTAPTNQDIWTVPMFAIPYKILLASPLLFIIYKFRGVSVNDIFEMIIGKIAGKIVTMIMILFMIFSQLVFISMSVIFINASVFPETPKWALYLYMFIPIIYAASKGAGTLARLSMFIVPYILLTIIAFFLMSLKDIDLFILKPILTDSSFMQLNQGAFLHANRMTEVLILLVFSKNMKKDIKLNSVFGWFLLFFTISIILMIIPTITFLGLDIAKHSNNPYFVFTRQVKAYDFIQRLESFNVLGWFVGMLFKLSIYNYMSSYLFYGMIKSSKTSKITYKNFVIPIALIVYILARLPQLSKFTTVEFLRSNRIFPPIVFLVTFVIPIIIVIVYLIRKNKIKELIKQNENKVQ